MQSHFLTLSPRCLLLFSCHQHGQTTSVSGSNSLAERCYTGLNTPVLESPRLAREQVGRSLPVNAGRGKSEHYRAASPLTAGRLVVEILSDDDKCNRKQTSSFE